MDFLKKNTLGMVFCLVIALVAWLLGKQFAIIGGPVFGILLGMVITLFIKDKSKLDADIKFTSLILAFLSSAVFDLPLPHHSSVKYQINLTNEPKIMKLFPTSFCFSIRQLDFSDVLPP